MVSQLLGLSAGALAARIETFLARPAAPSQRAFALQTGIARSTLQDLLRDPSKRRAATVENIFTKITSRAGQVTTQMVRTARVDAPLFTRDSLGAMGRPDNKEGLSPVGFRYVVHDETGSGRETGFATTALNSDPNATPLSALGMAGDDPDAVVSVVWVYR